MIDLLGLKLEHPVMVSAGPMGESAVSVDTMFRHGASAVITKTIAGLESEHKKIYKLGNVLFNKDGYSKRSVEDWFSYLEAVHDKNIIANIFADNKEELLRIAHGVEVAGVKVIEVCLSCGTRDQEPICFQLSIMEELCKQLRKAIDVPLVVKLMISNSMHLNWKMVQILYNAGIDGISVTDSIPGMVLNQEQKLMFGGAGGLSGKFLKPMVVKFLHDVEKIPITKIAYGGVHTGRDVCDYLYCGATAVGVCSAILQKGNSQLERIRDEYQDIISGVIK